MNQMTRLSQLPEGACATVTALPPCGVSGRLLDLGMIPGTSVRCVRRAPSGSPIAYEIRGAVVALRRADAAKISVRMDGK